MRIKAFALSILIFIGSGVFAQEEKQLQKEVLVVRPYEPTISDAFKINILPEIADTIKVKPNFLYNIVPRPLIKSFAPKPVTAAKMVAEPLDDTKSNYLRLGLGTHLMPMAEFYYGSQRNKEWQYGMWIKHLSSFGDVKLENDKKVDADFSNTDISLFGKKLIKDRVLQGSLEYQNRKYLYYGYNYMDTAALATSDKQKLNRLKAMLEYRTVEKDSSDLNYSARLNFEHLGDNFDMKENKIQLLGGLDKYMKKEQFGGEFSFTHYNKNKSLSPDNNSLIMLSPWVNLFGRQWRVQVGFIYNLDMRGGEAEQYFYPRAYMSYNIVSDYITPYVEIDGLLEQNSYSKILDENLWVVPGLNVWNTNHKMILRGGVKGKFNSQVAYNVLASYSIVDSMYFFQNCSVDASNPLFNRFNVTYDIVELTKVVGELTIAPMSRLNILLHAEYHSYKMDKLEYAWHKPDYVAYGSIRYNLKDKLITTLRVYMLGDRRVIDGEGKSELLKSNFDMNLGLEYLYNRRASAFLNLNNITAAKNSNWYLYPTHRFNIHAGITFSFQ